MERTAPLLSRGHALPSQQRSLASSRSPPHAALAEESRLRAVVAECDQALTECASLQATLEEANKAMESPESAPQSEQSLATVGARVAAAEEKVDRVVEAVEEVVSDLWLKPIGDLSSIYDDLYAQEA